MYRGFVNDGWGIDANGKHFFRPRPEADRLRELRELQVDAVAADVEDLIDAGLVGVSADTAKRVAAARSVLARVPDVIVKAVFRAGGRIQILACDDIDGKYLGVTRNKTAIVAGDDEDAAKTLLHEVGHLVDRIKGWWWLSSSDPWRMIWQRDRQAGQVPVFARQQDDAAEYLAETFAEYWLDQQTRARLTPAVLEFHRNLPKLICVGASPLCQAGRDRRAVASRSRPGPGRIHHAH